MTQQSYQTTRSSLEAKIEELVSLLDLLDGDENLEDDGMLEDDGTLESEETDQNGDELDYSHTEDGDWSGLGCDGTGVEIAERLLSSVHIAARRAHLSRRG
jgi:hypothetical protein